MAVKQCLDSGNWFSVHEGNPFFEWTDYRWSDQQYQLKIQEMPRLELSLDFRLLPLFVTFPIFRQF